MTGATTSVNQQVVHFAEDIWQPMRPKARVQALIDVLPNFQEERWGVIYAVMEARKCGPYRLTSQVYSAMQATTTCSSLNIANNRHNSNDTRHAGPEL
jgi:hypothetical protein